MGNSSGKKSKSKQSPIPENPQSLADFGYEWVKDPESADEDFKISLKKISDGSRFTFVNQKHYEALSNFAASSIADLIQDTFDLDKIMLPLDEHAGSCVFRFPIYTSKDFYTNKRLFVFVLGAGKVEVGQWSRKLCMNDSLAEGSLLPFLHQAIRVRHSAVILTNPNINQYMETETQKVHWVPGSKDPNAHLLYLWENFISKSNAEEIVFIAHSFGGVATMSLLSNKAVTAALMPKLKAVCLTDSVHGGWTGFNGKLTKSVAKWLLQNGINYVRSDRPLGTRYQPAYGTQQESAGTEDHEQTSYYCRELLWQFVDARIEQDKPQSRKQKKHKKTEKVDPATPKGTSEDIEEKNNEEQNEENQETKTSKSEKEEVEKADSNDKLETSNRSRSTTKSSSEKQNDDDDTNQNQQTGSRSNETSSTLKEPSSEVNDSSASE